MIWDWPYWAQLLLAYIVIQRLGELLYARANDRRMLADGGREYGGDHYFLFILLHGGWLFAIAFFARPLPEPPGILLMIFFVVQILRFWTLASIGRWWSTRIISAPHFPRISTGPYKYFAHPNYAVVVMEIAIVPVLLGSAMVAGVFSILNALLLRHRIRIEAGILAERD